MPQTKVFQNEQLTLREIEVLELVSYGLTTREIAKQLYISMETVNTHRKRMFQKLKVKNAAGLVRIAFQKGYLMVC